MKSNISAIINNTSTGFEKYQEKTQDLGLTVHKYYKNTIKYHKKTSSTLDINIATSNKLMNSSVKDGEETESDISYEINNLEKWSSSNKNYKTIYQYKQHSSYWNGGGGWKNGKTVVETPETISKQIKYNASGFEYKSGVGVCYQTLTGDRTIELHVKTTTNTGSEIFDTKIATLRRNDITKSDEIQFISKAHELDDGRIVIVWTHANESKVSREIYAKSDCKQWPSE